MLTRHSPPRGIRRCRSGVVGVGESDGRPRSARASSDRPYQSLLVPLLTVVTSRSTLRIVDRPLPMRMPPQNKKRPQAILPVPPGRQPRFFGSVSDPGRQAGFLPDRCVGQTPTRRLELVPTKAAHRKPPNRQQTASEGVAFGHPKQSQDQIQAKNLRTTNYFRKRVPQTVGDSRRLMSGHPSVDRFGFGSGWWCGSSRLDIFHQDTISGTPPGLGVCVHLSTKRARQSGYGRWQELRAHRLRKRSARRLVAPGP